MRTIVDIPEHQLQALNALCAREHISRAEAVRRTLQTGLFGQPQAEPKVTLADVFGMWKDYDDIGDAVDYQRKLRAEWDREWDKL